MCCFQTCQPFHLQVQRDVVAWCCTLSFRVCACASVWARSICWKECSFFHVIPLNLSTNSRASSQIGQTSLFFPIVKSRWKILIKDPKMYSRCSTIDTLHGYTWIANQLWRNQHAVEQVSNNDLSIGSSCSVTMYCFEVEASWSGRHGNHGSR